MECGAQSLYVILAEDPALAVQVVLGQFAGALELWAAEETQVGDEVISGSVSYPDVGRIVRDGPGWARAGRGQ